MTDTPTDRAALEALAEWAATEAAHHDDMTRSDRHRIEKLEAIAATLRALASHADPPADPRPYDCRFRQQAEGRPYPRSSCAACGKNVSNGLGKHCFAVATVAHGPTPPPAAP